MSTVTGQTVCVAIEHETQPDKTAIPEILRLAGLGLAQRGVLYLPYFRAQAENSICHCIAFAGSMEPREEWINGIVHNSRYFIGFIYPSKQWTKADESERYHVGFSPCGRRLPAKLIARKNLTLEDAVNYVVKQISKLKGA